MNHLNKIIVVIIPFLFLLAYPLKMYSQNTVRFQAYGKTPQTVSDSLYKKLENTSEINQRLSILYTIANKHKKYGSTDSLLHYANLIKDLSSSENDKIKNIYLHKARAHRLLGNGKFLNGLYDEALKAYIEGITDSKEAEGIIENNQIKLGLGKVYLQKKEYEKASSLFLELTENRGDANIVAQANFYLGVLAFEKEHFSLAKKYYTKAIANTDTEEDSKFKLLVELNLGILAAKEDRNYDAFNIHERIMAAALKNNYFDLYTEAVLQYGKVCSKLKQYQNAEIVLSIAYSNAIQWNRLELQKKIINSLRLTYQAKGDYKNAYNLMTQYISVSNEIIEQQNSKVIKDLEVKYETLQKENQIYELQKEQSSKQVEIERQKTIKKAFLYGFIILLIPIITLLVVYYQKLQTQSQLNHQQKELNNQKITALLSSQELELTRTSLEAQQDERHRIAKQLHDGIGGNLAGIKLQLANIKTSVLQKEVMHQVNETYELVRDISHDLVPKKFNQNAFTFLIENYIEQLQKNSELEITFSAYPKDKINDLPEKLKVEFYQITQELFTNTLKHANASNIEVHINIHNTTLQLIFEDDGKGFKVENFRKGIGLQNIESRLQPLNANLIIDSTSNRGTVVTIEVPLKKQTREKLQINYSR